MTDDAARGTWPILYRLDLDATGPETNIDNYRKDAADAAAEILHLRDVLRELVDAATELRNHPPMDSTNRFDQKLERVERAEKHAEQVLSGKIETPKISTRVPRPQVVIGSDNDELEMVWFVNGYRISGHLDADGTLVWLKAKGRDILESSENEPGCLVSLFTTIQEEMANER